jgi:hypothetical protein
MKRSNDGTQSKKKRTKNKFSLASFGLSLKPSNAVRAGKLTADGRRADIRVVPIQRERTPVPPSPAPEDDWVDMQVDDEPPADSRPPRKRKWYATTVRVFFDPFTFLPQIFLMLGRQSSTLGGKLSRRVPAHARYS